MHQAIDVSEEIGLITCRLCSDELKEVAPSPNNAIAVVWPPSHDQKLHTALLVTLVLHQKQFHITGKADK